MRDSVSNTGNICLLDWLKMTVENKIIEAANTDRFSMDGLSVELKSFMDSELDGWIKMLRPMNISNIDTDRQFIARRGEGALRVSESLAD